MVFVMNENTAQNKPFEYVASAGQSGYPVANLTTHHLGGWEMPQRPEPLLPDPVLNEAHKDFFYVSPPLQHFLPGITAEMMDWFWANMEKCYFLWGPGSHKMFRWVKEPWKYGYVGSSHVIAENLYEGGPIIDFSDSPMTRLDMDEFPFMDALEHVLMEGRFDESGTVINNNIHMWQDCEGGLVHITCMIQSAAALPPGVTPEMVVQELSSPPEVGYLHPDFEAARWPKFLPTLFELWKGHPDPTQNVLFDLSVQKNQDGNWEYVHENGPVQYE